MSRPQPPRALAAILTAILPKNIHGRSILGDLHEEFVEMASTTSIWSARLWYAWQAIGLVASYARPGHQGGYALMQDTRRAARGLISTPAFTFSLVGSIALAVGAGTAVVSVVDTVLLRPLPFEQPEQLFRVWASDQQTGEIQSDLSYPEAKILMSALPAFSSAGGFSIAPRTILDAQNQRPMEVRVARTLGDPLGTLRAKTTRGRLFSETEREQGLPVVLISSGLWDSRFDRNPSMVGSSIQIEDDVFQVVGVLSPDADLAEGIDIWRPLRPEETEDEDREVFTLGRLASGASVLALQEQLQALDHAFAEQGLRPDHIQSWTQSLHSVVVGDVRTALWAFLGAVTLLLTATCANTANLLVSRATRRNHDTAVRRSLGAGGWQLVRFQAIESLLIGLLGGTLGLGLGVWVLDLLLASSPPVPRLHAVTLDVRIASVVFAVTVAAGLASAIGPSIAALKQAPADLLGTTRSTATKARRLGQSAFVFAQVSLSTVLTVLAFVLFATFQNVSHFDRGFSHEGLFILSLEPERDFDSADERADLFHRILESVKDTPGIEAAALASHQVVEQRGFVFEMTVGGDQGPQTKPATLRIVSPEFFRSTRIQVRSGRGFSPAPTDQAGEIIVNEAFVRSHLGDNPRVLGTEVSGSVLAGHIIGIVGDVSPHPSEPARPIAYISFATLPLAGARLIFRAEEGAAIVPSLWDAIRSIEPTILPSATENVAATLVDARLSERFNMSVAALFSIMALGLSAIGVYGVMNHHVATRRREIGIRRALGASAPTLAWNVFTTSLRMVVFAILAGLGAAFVGQRWLGSMLVETAAGDPFVLLGVALTLIAVASLSAMSPILKAVAVRPTEAFRGD